MGTIFVFWFLFFLKPIPEARISGAWCAYMTLSLYTHTHTSPETTIWFKPREQTHHRVFFSFFFLGVDILTLGFIAYVNLASGILCVCASASSSQLSTYFWVFLFFVLFVVDTQFAWSRFLGFFVEPPMVKTSWQQV